MGNSVKYKINLVGEDTNLFGIRFVLLVKSETDETEDISSWKSELSSIN